jgi:hypothetical protein
MTDTTAPRRNIGDDGVKIRTFFGGLFFVFSLGMMALLTVVGAPIVVRMTVFLPAWLSALSLLQARAGTCVFLAARGACSTDMGTEPLDDPEARSFFVRRAGRIHFQALALAALLTMLLVTLSVLIPWRVPAGG